MFGLRLLRLTPEKFRPAIASAADRLRNKTHHVLLALEPLPRRSAGFGRDGKVIIAGLFASPTGIGQGSRLMFADMKLRGLDVAAVDFTQALGLTGDMRHEHAYSPQEIIALDPAEIVIHSNPPLFLSIYLSLPRKVRRRCKIIAYWAWELDRAPCEWRRATDFCDEIWVPSGFVAEALKRMMEGSRRPPIKVVPHAVDALPLAPRKTRMSQLDARKRFGLPHDAFIAGFSFAMSSNFARKNPLAAVAAFREAFPTSTHERTILILRCNDGVIYPPGLALLHRAAADDSRILIADGETISISMLDLYQVIDVYLALHRSEGYGLNLAEAARLGTPVVTTDWGLAEDIRVLPEVVTVCSTQVPVEDPQGVYCGLGARWAEPNITEAAAHLRRLQMHVFSRQRLSVSNDSPPLSQ